MKFFTYTFHLGRQKELSRAEILSVLEYAGIQINNQRIVGEYFLISTDTPIDAQALMDILGGTRLIGEKLHAHGNAKNTIFTYLESLPTDKKLHFSISGGKNLEDVAVDVKKKLKIAGRRSVRFVKTINTATILHNGLVDRGTHFTVIDNVVFVTRAIQPIEEMSERDYGRPKPDSFSGMLPPKLARIMINLVGYKKNDTLLDPFCGSGTLLGEAISLGIKNIVGSDLSIKAVSDSKKNLTWLQENITSETKNLKLYNLDVREITKEIDLGSINVIATEPLMGILRKGREQKFFLIEQSRELKSLYLDAFNIFKKILKSDGRIVFIIPRFRHGDGWITIDCKEDIERLGFELIPYGDELSMPIVYHRDGQYIGREIWRWRKII